MRAKRRMEKSKKEDSHPLRSLVQSRKDRKPFFVAFFLKNLGSLVIGLCRPIFYTAARAGLFFLLTFSVALFFLSLSLYPFYSWKESTKSEGV